MCVCVSACPAQMDWSTFFHVQKGNFLRWGSERLPGWFVHFLAHFGNVKKQMKKIGSKKVVHGARLTEGARAKAIWAMPL